MVRALYSLFLSGTKDSSEFFKDLLGFLIHQQYLALKLSNLIGGEHLNPSKLTDNIS